MLPFLEVDDMRVGLYSFLLAALAHENFSNASSWAAGGGMGAGNNNPNTHENPKWPGVPADAPPSPRSGAKMFG